VLVSFSRVVQLRRSVPLLCPRLQCLRAQWITNNLPMQRLQSYYSSCAHGCSSEYKYCDMHIMQHLKLLVWLWSKLPENLAFTKVWYHLLVNCLVMASRRPIYVFQLTGYATESNETKFICCFLRATHTINNIYKLISFLNLYLHGFRDNEVLLQAGYDVIVIYPPGVASGCSWRILKERL